MVQYWEHSILTCHVCQVLTNCHFALQKLSFVWQKLTTLTLVCFSQINSFLKRRQKHCLVLQTRENHKIFETNIGAAWSIG